jgi:hypothetical protein
MYRFLVTMRKLMIPIASALIGLCIAVYQSGAQQTVAQPVPSPSPSVSPSPTFPPVDCNVNPNPALCVRPTPTASPTPPPANNNNNAGGSKVEQVINNLPTLPSVGSPTSGGYEILFAQCGRYTIYRAGSAVLRRGGGVSIGDISVNVAADEPAATGIEKDTVEVSNSMGSIFKRIAAGLGNLCEQLNKEEPTPKPSGKGANIPKGDPLPKGNPQGEDVELTPPGKPVRALY